MIKEIIVSTPCISCNKYPYDCNQFYYTFNPNNDTAIPVPQSYKYSCNDLIRTETKIV